MKFNYQECSDYIKNKLKINLFDYQEDMLRYLCNETEFRSARGIGRSFVVDAFSKYVAYKLDKNSKDISPDIIITGKPAIRYGIMPQSTVDKIKENGNCYEYFLLNEDEI